MAHGESVFPASLIVSKRHCLVVGGGAVAARKAAALLDAGAEVTMIAPRISAPAGQLPVHAEERPYRQGEAGAYWLVITATGDPAIDGQVFADASAAHVFVNSADDPERCSFHLPAVLRRGEISVAVATGGAAPGLAVWLRDRIAADVGEEFATLAARVGAVRVELRARGAPTEGRDWPALITALLAISPGDGPGAARAVARWLGGDEVAAPTPTGAS